MKISDAFDTEVMEAAGSLPPARMAELQEYTESLIHQQFSLVNEDIGQAENREQVVRIMQSVTEILVFNAFLAGRALSIHETDDTIEVPMDRDTLAAFVQYLTTR